MPAAPSAAVRDHLFLLEHQIHALQAEIAALQSGLLELEAAFRPVDGA